MSPREPSVRMAPRGRTESLAVATLAALSIRSGHLQRKSWNDSVNFIKGAAL